MNIIHLPCSSFPLQSSCYFSEACVYIVRLHVRQPLLMVVHAVYSFLPEEEGAELRYDKEGRIPYNLFFSACPAPVPLYLLLEALNL